MILYELKVIPKFTEKYLNTKYMRYVDDCFLKTSCKEKNKLLL